MWRSMNGFLHVLNLPLGQTNLWRVELGLSFLNFAEVAESAFKFRKRTNVYLGVIPPV